MKAFKFLGILALSCGFCTGSVYAEKLGSESFNVTLTLSPTHYVTVSDLDFGYVDIRKLSDDALPLESTTGSLVAYSNSLSGHFVRIEASDKRFQSEDGYSFLLRGQTKGNDDAISFILKTSFNPDGTKAEKGNREILPSYIIASTKGADEDHKVVRDVWAALRDNSELKKVSADSYLAVLQAIHYTNE